VNGHPVVAAGDLPATIGQAMPGEKVTLGIWREGESIERTAQLGDLNEKAPKLAKSDEGSDKGKLGLVLRSLAPQERREAGVTGGLVIEEVQGPAARAGVQPGDLLLSVNGKSVRDADEVRKVVRGAGKSVALLVQREGSRLFIPVRIG
jgi:serine protease Do